VAPSQRSRVLWEFFHMGAGAGGGGWGVRLRWEGGR